MKLGIISAWSDAGLAKVAEYGLGYAEVCLNNPGEGEAVYNNVAAIKESCAKYGVNVASMGRWGVKRLLPDGSFNPEELKQDKFIVAAAAEVGCPVFNMGVNPIKDMSFEDNAALAVEYIKEVKAYADEKGVKVALYNCDWENILFDKRGWDIALPAVPGLGIKYDTSHCINRNGDTLKEMLEYGKYIYHFHVKGTLRIDGRHVDDPPAGLDQTPWGAVMDLLYIHDYEGVLSIEPHSHVWCKGKRADWGVLFTKNFISKFILED